MIIDNSLTPGPKKPIEGETNLPEQEKPAVGETQSAGLLYLNPCKALEEVRKDYLYWTEKLTDSSFALSVAVIGANWAVFGAVNKIINNCYSQISIALVLFGLGIGVVGAKNMGELHRKRIEYAEASPKQWEKEFKDTLGKKDPWPFTRRIEIEGQVLRMFKTWCPLLGGFFFLMALLFN